MFSKLDNVRHAPESRVLDNQKLFLLSPGTVGPGRRKQAGDVAKTGNWRRLPAGSELVLCTLLLDDPQELFW